MKLTKSLTSALSLALSVPILFVPAQAQTAASMDLVTWGTFETREYRSENGRRIRITSRGNLVALEAPYGFEHLDNGGRAREGYVVSYGDPATGASRVVHDVNDSYSRSLGGHRDLVPYMFRGPAAGTTFAVNTLVTATVIVDTFDGVLRLTHQFEWRAGFGKVKVTTTVANRLGGFVSLGSFKRHAHLRLDSAGLYGIAATSDQSRLADGILFWIRCNCAPPTPPSPLTPESVSLHAMSFSGSPAPMYKAIKPAGDTSELTSAGPAAGSDLSGSRYGENNQGTLIWGGSRLGAGGSQSFTAEYQLQ